MSNRPDKLQDYWISQALREIEADDGVVVSVDYRRQGLNKFGRNLDLDTGDRATIWDMGVDNETLVDDNLITHISSSSASDTVQMTIIGHTIDGSGNFTEVKQTRTLAGQTKTALLTPLARVNRCYNSSSTDLVGDVYVYQDTAETNGVPSNLNLAHIKVNLLRQQSNKCQSTTADGEYLLIMSFDASVQKAQAASMDVEFQVKEPGGVWRERAVVGTVKNTGGALQLHMRPYLIVRPNSDFRLLAEGFTNSTFCVGQIQGVFASVVD